MRRGITGVLWLLWSLSTFTLAFAQQPPDFSSGLRSAHQADLATLPDVPQYTFDLALDADYQQATLTGTGQIIYVNTTDQPLTEIVLRLYANLLTFGGQATLSNVSINGQAVEPTLDVTRSVAGIPFPAGLSPGMRADIRFDYALTVFYGHERLYNQLSYLQTEIALASALPLLSVYENGWWRETIHAYGDAVYSEAANFDVTLTTPDYLNLITSGTEISRQANPNSTITTRYVAPLMRDFAIMASGRYQTLSGQVEDIRVEVHYLPNGLPAAERILIWALDSITAFSERFGAYPYAELDVVQTWTSAGGIEYPGLIVLSSTIWNLNDPWLEWVTVHEVAHQWWYGLVGNDQTRFPWVDEALTEFSVAVYYEAVQGQVGYDTTIATYERLYRAYDNQAELVGNPPAAYDSEFAYGAIVYRKGALFFHMLSQMLGRDVFFASLQNYLASHRYGVAAPTALQDAFEQTSGMPLDAWFVEWVGYSN